MRGTLILHIAAGAVALVAGYVAIFTAKGRSVHRRSGTVFVFAMLVMGAGGVTVAAVERVAPGINVPAGLLTSYLVITALTTVKPPRRWGPPLHVGAMLLALAVGLTSLTFGFEAVALGGMRDGIPAFPYFMFGVVGLLGVVGDLRVLRSGPLLGAPRLARHLWRMSFALLVAALSFFIGQADVFPKPIRIPGVLALPVLAVLVTMLYWLWRVRVRRSLRGLVVARVPDPVG